MAVGDYDKTKTADVTSVTGSPTLSNLPIPIRIEGGATDSTGTGVCQIDTSDTTVDGQEDIAIYDNNDNLLDYYWEVFDTTNDVYVAHVRTGITRDGSTQLKIGYGNGSTDESSTTETVFDSVGNSLESSYDLAQTPDTDNTTDEILDRTTSSRDGDTVGSTQVSAQYGDGLDFDGTDDGVDISADSPISGSFAFEVWYNADAVPSTIETLIRFDNAGEASHNTVMDLRFKDTGELIMEVRDSGGTLNTAEDTADTPTNEWIHAVGVYDDTNGTMKLYRDGTEVASTSQSFGTFDTTGRFGIGGNPESADSLGQTLDGQMDEVSIYNSTVSSDWVQARFDASAKASWSLLSWNASQGSATTDTAVKASGVYTSRTTSEVVSATDTATKTTGAYAARTTAETSTATDTAVKPAGVYTARTSLETSSATDTATKVSGMYAARTSTEVLPITDTAVKASGTYTALASTEQVVTRTRDEAVKASGGYTALVSDETVIDLDTAVKASGVYSARTSVETSSATDTSSKVSGVYSARTSVEFVTKIDSSVKAIGSYTSLTSDELLLNIDEAVKAAGVYSVRTSSELRFPVVARPTECLITTADTFLDMDDDRSFKVGDTADSFTARLRDEDGVVQLTTADKVELFMRTRDGSTSFNAEMSVEDASQGDVKYEWQQGDPIDTVGTYFAEVKVTFQNGMGEQTFPNDGYVLIEVEEDLE